MFDEIPPQVDLNTPEKRWGVYQTLLSISLFTMPLGISMVLVSYIWGLDRSHSMNSFMWFLAGLGGFLILVGMVTFGWSIAMLRDILFGKPNHTDSPNIIAFRNIEEIKSTVAKIEGRLNKIEKEVKRDRARDETSPKS